MSALIEQQFSRSAAATLLWSWRSGTVNRLPERICHTLIQTHTHTLIQTHTHTITHNHSNTQIQGKTYKYKRAHYIQTHNPIFVTFHAVWQSEKMILKDTATQQSSGTLGKAQTHSIDLVPYPCPLICFTIAEPLFSSLGGIAPHNM